MFQACVSRCAGGFRPATRNRMLPDTQQSRYNNMFPKRLPQSGQGVRVKGTLDVVFYRPGRGSLSGSIIQG